MEQQQVGNETYGFDAIRGIQAGREFYVAMCPLKIIPKLFIFNDYDIPPQLRAQRVLRESRIPAIKNYILNNPKNYIFSSLTASVDGVMKFFSSPSLGDDAKLGRLYINMEAKLLINDGQHRRKAIEEALKEKPELGHEMISVVFFQDNGLKRSQQMFSDLNKNAVKPTKSLGILYDHRDPFNAFIVELVNSIPVFQGRVELERTSLSNRTSNIFTLNGISDATARFLKTHNTKKLTTKEKELVKDFWTTVAKNMPQWQLVLQEQIKPKELRDGYVNAHTNLLNVLGIVGSIVCNQYPDNWKEKLSKLKDIDWSRENPDWQGQLVLNGRMVKNATGIELATNTILKKLGAKVDQSREKYEGKQ